MRRSLSRLRFLGLAAALTSSINACSPTRGQHTRVDPPAPGGDPYQPPDPLPHAAPGTLIWAQRVTEPKLNPPGTIWRILYHSRSRTNRDIAVSGFAIVPVAPTAPAHPRPVYAWAHGSAGQGDQCAPSHDIRDNLPPYGGELVARGAVLVATDYEGLGTPGEPTYLVGVAEGQDVLDSARAVAQLPGAGRPGPVILAGQSQGGGAALWAAQIARSYAPELDIRGVVGLAPAAELPSIARALASAPYSAYVGNVLLAADGLHAGYGAAFDPSEFLTAAALRDLPRVATQCIDAAISDWKGHQSQAVISRDPTTIPAIEAVLEENSPGLTNPGVPVLLAQGEQDQQIPLQVSAQLESRYCRLGATVIRHLYAGADHDGVVDAAQSDVVQWVTDRLLGRPAPNDCQPER